MAKTRAEVLSDIVALGLSADEADEELSGREAEAERMLAAASEADRAETLRRARAMLRSTQLLYVTPRAERLLYLWLDDEDEPSESAFVLAEPAPFADEGSTDESLAAGTPSLDGLRNLGAGARRQARDVVEHFRTWARASKWRPATMGAGLAVGLFAIVALIVVLSGGQSEPKYTTETLAAVATAPGPPPPEARVAVAPKYEVPYTLSKKRFDGGKTLYVLIEPVDLSNDIFKEDIKLLIKGLVAAYGGKISIEIHDDRDSLNLSYKQLGERTLTRPRTPEEVENEALHFVAAFNGQLETGMYLNTLQFFNAASSDDPTVGKYVEDLDFDPR